MSEAKQKSETKIQQRERRRTARVDRVEGTPGVAAPEKVEKGSILPSGDSFEYQAGRLRDGRLLESQRQDLAADIGRRQGNQHLQRLVSSVDGGSEPASAIRGNQEKIPSGRSASAKSGGASSKGSRLSMSKKKGRSIGGKRSNGDRSSREAIEAMEIEAEGSAGAGPPTMAPGEPPIEDARRDGGHAIQRQEQEGEAPAVTPEEKAAAQAAAQAAKAQAGQAKSKNQTEVGKSRAAKSKEAQKAKAAKSKKQAESAVAEEKKSERKAAKEKSETNGKGPKGKTTAPPGKVPGALPEAAPTAVGDQAPASPEQDPGFQAVVGKAQVVAGKKKSHIPAAKKAEDAQAAAISPPSEQSGKAAAVKAEEVEATETPGFDKAAFKAKVMERIQAMAPKTAEEADSFKESGKLDSAKGEMKADVAAEKDAAAGPMEEKAGETPDPGAVPPKTVKPLKAEGPGEAPPPLGAEQAAPKPKAQSEVEKPLQQRAKSLDDRLKEAEIKEETLAKSNEPEMVQAVEAKREAQAHAEQAPREYRVEEESKIAAAKQEAQTVAQEKTQAMHSQKASALTQVQEAQVGTKSEDEAKRAEIAGRLNTIYSDAKSRVESILGEMDGEVESTFDAGASAAKQAFEDYVDSATEAWKQERYGGWLGWARWIEDQVFSHPEIMRIANRGRELFLKKMDAVVDNVVEIIARGISEAKAEVARGRKEMQDYLASLPEHLQQIGQQAAESYRDKFDQLEADVDAKQDELVNTLAEKYNQHLEAVNARISEIEEANKGLYDKAKDAVEGAIQTILRLKDMLLNVLASAAAVIDKIIGDPIGFLGNLISGVKQGFENFVGNILTHLQAGLIGWLTGAMGDLGIEMPEDIFSLEGIFSLVTQVLGITYDYIRAKAVKHLGEPVVKALETGFEVFQILMNEGPMGLWQYVKQEFSDLKEMVIEQIKTIVVEQVIKAGVKWVLGLMSPAGALVKAAMMIYDIVMFFIQRAGQIVELVQAVINSIAAIASGSVGQVASAIENALAKALPVVISFMANLLGLRGLSKKVKRVITRVRRKVDRAIDKLILKAKKAARKILRRMRGDRGAREDEKVKAEDVEEEDPGEVIEGVRKEVAGRISGPIDDPGRVQPVLQSIYQKYQPDGLKYIDVIEDEGKPGHFKVVASASPGTDVGEFDTGLGILVGDLLVLTGQAYANVTTLTAFMQTGGSTVNLGTHTSRDPHNDPGRKSIHAEEHLLDTLDAMWPSPEEEGDPEYDTGVPSKERDNHIVINLTRSPCSACATDLNRWVAEKRGHGWPITMSISTASVYGGTKKGEGGEDTRRPIREDTEIALERLRAADVHLSAWDVLEFMKELGMVDEESMEQIDQAKLQRRIDEVKAVLSGLDSVKVGSGG